MDDHTYDLGHWIKRYYLTAIREIDALLKPYGLGRTQWFIMCHLAITDEMSQRELQTWLDVESATLTKLVMSLVDKGWVAQRPHAQDKRSKVLCLTPQGSRCLEGIPNPIDHVQARALRGIDKADITIAKQVIERAVQNLQDV